MGKARAECGERGRSEDEDRRRRVGDGTERLGTERGRVFKVALGAEGVEGE